MKVFLDTNILFYAVDPREPVKRAKARDLLRSKNSFVISTQVLQELFVCITSKCSISPLDAKQILRSLSWAELVTVTPAHIDLAVDLHILNKISFWDGIIMSSAQLAKCSVVWTEDLNSGQSIGGVRVENPFLN
jgi:predicted nucleic acid-binding protein